MRSRRVLTVALVLACVVPVACSSRNRRAEEASLRTNLRTLREVIVQYHGDKGRYPSTLEALVEEGLLRRMPSDPMTESDSTWIVIREAAAPGDEGGIVDVRSGASGLALDGTSYRDW